jgi:hypothetical protein
MHRIRQAAARSIRTRRRKIATALTLNLTGSTAGVLSGANLTVNGAMGVCGSNEVASAVGG